MNDFFLAVVLGVIEGLTEFLPVSSTAHLRITESLMNISLDDPFWKMFSIVIQLGAILCLPIYFWKRILEFVHDFPKGPRGDRTVLNHPLTLTMIAFVVTAIPAFLLTKIIGKHLESLWIMAIALIVGGVVMWVVDAIYERSRHRAFLRDGKLTTSMDQMCVGQAIWIGACQILSAVFPGTSRSMSTITAGELAGMSRQVRARILVLPVHPDDGRSDPLRPAEIIASPPWRGEHNWCDAQRSSPLDRAGHRLRRFLHRCVRRGRVVHEVWVRTRGFAPFAIYRILVGIAVLWWITRAHG